MPSSKTDPRRCLEKLVQPPVEEVALTSRQLARRHPQWRLTATFPASHRHRAFLPRKSLPMKTKPPATSCRKNRAFSTGCYGHTQIKDNAWRGVTARSFVVV
jgi:hypothetical protein